MSFQKHNKFPRTPIFLALAAAFLLSPAAYAQTATGNDSTATGTGSYAFNYGTADGAYAVAAGNGSLAVGGYSTAAGDHSIAVGFGSRANSSGCSSLNYYVNMQGYCTQWGMPGVIGDAGVELATPLTNGGVAVGHSSSALANDAVALGGFAAVSIGATGGIAIGAHASVSDAAIGSVAIGAGSSATEAMVVSIGAAYGGERRLVNMAPGVNATDGVNFAQLAAVKAIATAAQTAAAKAQNTANLANTRAMTPGPVGATGSAGVAGAAGTAGVDGATGAQGDAGAAGAAGAAGVAGNDGATGAAGLNGKDGATGAQGVAGNDGAAGIGSVTQTAALVSAATDATQGQVSIQTSDSAAPKASITLTNRLGNTHGLTITETQTTVSGGAHSTVMTIDDNGVKFANVQSGDAVVVSGVATGVAATDAANVGQVGTAITNALAPIDTRLGAVETELKTVDGKISDAEQRVSGGVAMAMALTQPVVFAPGKVNAITGGVANFNGASALAFGFNRLIALKNDTRLVLSVGAGVTTTGQHSARAGASFSF